MTALQNQYWQLQETKRHQRVEEGINQQNANTNVRNAVANERNADSNARNADTNLYKARIDAQNAVSNRITAEARDYDVRMNTPVKRRLDYLINSERNQIDLIKAQAASKQAVASETQAKNQIVSGFSSTIGSAMGRMIGGLAVG